jgi:hypothetical protein
MKFIILILLAFCSAFSANPVIQAMQPDTWYEVPDTWMKLVCLPCVGPLYGMCGNSDCKAVINNWSGGTFDTKRNRLLLWGGGHKAYGGNELYGFSLDSLKWERINNPSPPEECVAILADNTPNSRHTYGLPIYLPTLDKFFAIPGVGIYCPPSGADPNTWTFDFTDKTWTNMNPGGGSMSGSHGGAAYDPFKNRVLSFMARSGGTGGLWEYDVASNVWTNLNPVQSNLHGGGYINGAIDTKRNKLYILGSNTGKLVVYDIGNNNYTERLVTTTGGGSDVLTGAPGVVYDPVADKIVAWDGGPVWVLDPETFQFEQKRTCPQQPAANGTYGRFSYSPKENAYVVVNAYDQNVLIYKLTAGAGIESRTPVSSNLKISALPNPFNKMTKIAVSYQLSAVSKIQVSVFNVAGKQITKLTTDSRQLTAGISWDASGHPSGIYIAKVKIGNKMLRKKLFLYK